jgi:hypothetical protein
MSATQATEKTTGGEGFCSKKEPNYNSLRNSTRTREAFIPEAETATIIERIALECQENSSMSQGRWCFTKDADGHLDA